jgi:hypothetical protein
MRRRARRQYRLLDWREFGYALLLRFHDTIHLDERKLKLGQYLFLKHGGKFVFGRFVAVLRAFAALLASINRMGLSCHGGVTGVFLRNVPMLYLTRGADCRPSAWPSNAIPDRHIRTDPDCRPARPDCPERRQRIDVRKSLVCSQETSLA